MPHNLYNQSSGYQPYCPIVVLPNFIPYGAPYPYHNNSFSPLPIPQSSSTYCQQITLPKSQNNPEQQYELYKPNNAKKNTQVAARNVDVGTVEDEIAELQITGEATADALSMGNKIILDKGASSHLTGNRSALFDFQLLQKPIPLRVATDSCNDFITGMGTMIFPGKNGTTVSVKGVMFCKNARSTLISPATVRRAKLIIDYDSATDTFLFKSASGKILLESPINSKKRSWTFPQPIRCVEQHQQPAACSIPFDSSLPASSISFSQPFPSKPTAMVSKPKIPNVGSDPLFTFPVSKYDFEWHASDLSQDGMKLLFWHHLFGHAALHHILKMINLKLGIGLPDQIPKSIRIGCGGLAYFSPLSYVGLTLSQGVQPHRFRFQQV
jgi:hypothetical protein